MNLWWCLESIKRDMQLSDDEKYISELLKKEYQEWVITLSSKEIHAIRKYTKNSIRENGKNSFYMSLNRMLESKNHKTFNNYKTLEIYAEVISTALSKHLTQHDIRCYRGTEMPPVTGINVGECFVYKGFISTSIFEKYAFKRKYITVIHVPKGIHAAYIDDISRYKGQYEYLIDKGYEYKLLSIKGNVYEMEVCI